MRLLERQPDGNLILREFTDKVVPAYAILSHTWSVDSNEEVSFQDVEAGSGKSKAGWKKITFCADRAKADGLRYFWIDTCCIDKKNKAKLSQAIRSMFQWYRKATRCYVYLLDVYVRKRKIEDENTNSSWEQAFRASKWFTRGWTLQELLAPQLVEFFSQECQRLGDKRSLRHIIQEVTCIPKSALEGNSLSQFSANQRFLWMEHRQTKEEEDKAYSLLGIFGVSMTPLYGEGVISASKRLREEIDKLEKCMLALRVTDPRDDKKRIEGTKGGLLLDSYRWILEHRDFKEWIDGQQSHLLWIKGDPGKGKTMLLCGVVDELKSMGTHVLSFFFCQATDSRINSATAVLRGLLYLLIDQQPSLISHIRKRHDHAGKSLFEDANAWVTLSDIFTDILQDPSLTSTYLIIDALDECITEREKLLDFIAEKSSLSSPHVKWLVSSRNWPSIEEGLDKAGNKVRLGLELNSESVSASVKFYIQHKVNQLAEEKKYDDKTQETLLSHLLSNANDTFLWVALVCQRLKNTPKALVRKSLNLFPPGLDALYERMIKQVSESEGSELCKQILASIATTYEPITLFELSSLIEMLEDISDDRESLVEMIGLCGSFLTIRNDTIYFVHQSAKDFLVEKASAEIFPDGIGEIHHEIYSRSLDTMSRTLRRDIYGLGRPGYPIEQVELPDPDPLAASRYSCIYWVDHLCESESHDHPNQRLKLQDGVLLDKFVREKFLYWLEALSLCKSMPKGVLSMAKLLILIQGRLDATELSALVHDAHRFIMYYKQGIEISPLQAYAAGLIFSPKNSLVRHNFLSHQPNWIKILAPAQDDWSGCRATLEGHSYPVCSVVFSHDSTLLASASWDSTVRIWDVSSGACLATLEGHGDPVCSVAFSHDSTLLASASWDRTVRIWDASSGVCQATLEGHSSRVRSVAFSHDSTLLVSASGDPASGDSASGDNTVRIWDVSSGTCRATLEGHSTEVCSAAFSHDSTLLASASGDHTVRIWDASSAACRATLDGHSDRVWSVAFSHNSTRLASASEDRTVRIWDVSSGACLATLDGHSGRVCSAIFSHDSTLLASASDDNMVRVWDASSGACQATLEGHSGWVRSVAFSHDSTLLASASGDHTVRIWDASSGSGAGRTTLDGHSNRVCSLAFSHNSTLLASASEDFTVRIWDVSSGACQATLNGHSGWVKWVVFSHNSTLLASASWDRTVRIWDASSGACRATLKGHSNGVSSVAFSHDSTLLASASVDSTVRIWDVSSGACQATLEGHSDWVTSVVFSHDSKLVASASLDGTVRIWDASSGAGRTTLDGNNGNCVHSVAFSPDSTLLASASQDYKVRIWDTSSGACRETLNVKRVFLNISYNSTGSHLHTEIGMLAVDTSPTSNTASDGNECQPQQFHRVGLSPRRDWVTCNAENVLWLPPEYRPWFSTISGGTIGIGVGSGKV